MKCQENVTNNQLGNQSLEINSESEEIIELTHKNV